MKKITVLSIVVLTSVLISCQKEYVCFCTHINSGISSFENRYKGTILSKKAADKSCKQNMDIEIDSLTNCHIE